MIKVNKHKRLNPETAPKRIEAIKAAHDPSRRGLVYKGLPYIIEDGEVWTCYQGAETLTDYSAYADPPEANPTLMKKTENTIRGRKVVQQGNRLVVEIQTGRGKAFTNIAKEELTTATRKLGSNRGKTRLWLEGNILENQGWTTGDKFDVILIDGVLKYVKNPNGSRKVAGKVGRPIIDTNTNTISDTLSSLPGEVVNVIATAESITVQK